MCSDEFGDRLIVIEEHTSGLYAIPWGTSRASWYGLEFVPTVEVDGVYEYVGASTCNGAYQTYRTAINNRLNVSSPVSIDGFYQYSGDEITLTATITLSPPCASTWRG